MEQMQNTVSYTKSVDVLFVTNQLRIPACIQRVLNENQLTWGRVDVTGFIDLVRDFEQIGTVLLDTTEIEQSKKHSFSLAIKDLEDQGVGTILLNNDIDFLLDDFKFLSQLTSADVQEFWGRVDSNTTYQKNVSAININSPESDRQPFVEKDRDNQLKMAGHVQQSFLPANLPNSDKLRWATSFHPADCVSGDIYDVTRLDEHHIGFYLADAVGHSVPAALLTMFIKQAITMRQTVGNDYEIFQPEQVIKKLNARMCEQELSGCLFATCCYCLLNIETFQLTFARAGHPYPILIRKGKPPVHLESRGGLLGAFEELECIQETIQLQKGDKFFLYSDGGESLIETRSDDDKPEFTKQFLSIAKLPVENMIEQFDRQITDLKVTPAEIDDITALALEII